MIFTCTIHSLLCEGVKEKFHVFSTVRSKTILPYYNSFNNKINVTPSLQCGEISFKHLVYLTKYSVKHFLCL